jgi:hypothetical protein
VVLGVVLDEELVVGDTSMEVLDYHLATGRTTNRPLAGGPRQCDTPFPHKP